MTEGKIDDRIVRGMGALKLKLQADLKSGAHQVGWKLAFGSPSGLKNLQIERPLVSYLLDRNQISSEETVKISSWSKPVGETEIAIYFAKDVPPAPTVDEVMDCICALGPAIEIADIDVVSTDPEPILAGNIFQRHYILGKQDALRAGGNIDGLSAAVTMPDGSISAVEDLQAMTGSIPMILHHFAGVVEEFSGGVKAGEFVIIGSILPPILVQPGDSLNFSLGDYPMLKVNFAD